MEQNILKIDTTTPLRINLVDAEGNTLRLLEEKSEEQRTKPSERLSQALSLLGSDTLFRVVLVGLVIVAIATAVLWLIYIRTNTYGLKHSDVGVDYAVEYCSWLTVGDENTVHITLVNTNNNPITNVMAYLTFSDTLPICTTPDSSNAVGFGSLAPGERKTRCITLLLPTQTSGRTEGKLQIEADQITKTELVSLPFAISRIPYLRTSITRGLGFFALALTSAFSWLVRGAMKDILPPD